MIMMGQALKAYHRCTIRPKSDSCLRKAKIFIIDVELNHLCTYSAMSPHTTSGSLPVFDSSLIRKHNFPNASQIRERLNNTYGLCIPIKARTVDTVKSTTLENTKTRLGERSSSGSTCNRDRSSQ